ncbi:MAG: PHP domain-containing protein, partial [Nitrospinota bacterium]
MRASDFVHLHLHSQYSLLDGAIRLKALMARATEYRMPALAITDHGSMYGAIKFHRAAKAAGIKPILGCELYVAPGSRLERAPVAEGGDQTYHLTVLARNEEGYRNLIQLVTRAHLEGFYYRPRVDRELLERYRRGLIAMSGCLSGEINQLLLSGLREKARLAASYYRELFGPEGFYLELQEQGLEEQKLLIPEMIELGKELGIPLVATNDVHYLDHRDHRAHEVLLCIQTGKTINDEKRLRMASDQFYFKSPGEMKTIFAELPDALSNTRVIAEMCELELEFGVRHHLPNYDPP